MDQGGETPLAVRSPALIESTQMGLALSCDALLGSSRRTIPFCDRGAGLMLSVQALDHYRRMTPAERIAEMCALLDVAERALEARAPEEIARRFAALDRERMRSKAALLAGLARLE